MRSAKFFLPLLMLLFVSACADDQLLTERAAVEKTFEWSGFNEDNPDGMNPDERAIVKDLYARIKPDMTELEKCDANTQSLWSLSKAGNLDARTSLSVVMVYGGINLRGINSDRKNSDNDFRIVAFHSIGSALWLHDAEKNRIRARHSRAPTSSDHYFNDEKFLNCAELTPSPACSAYAVEKGYIPSFADFAAEVERDAPDGLHQSCLKREEERLHPDPNRRKYY